MARLNVEDEILGDERFRALVRKLGDEDKALGLLLRFWRLAQKYWGQGLLVPVDIYDIGGFELLLSCHLIEQRKEGFYARGSEKHFGWYRQRVEAGKSRASGKRNDDGTFASGEPAADQRSIHNAVIPIQPLTLTLTPTHMHNSPNGESQSGPDAAVSAALLITLWNTHRGQLPECLRPSDQLRRKIKARWAEEPTLAYWEACIVKMAASSFCLEGGWASFHWLMKNQDNHAKVAAGNYDNRDGEAGIDWEKVFEGHPK